MRDDFVDRFLQLRRGPDGIDGTADDAQFKNLADIQYALGLSPEQFQQLAALVGFNDQVMRILSVGKSGNIARTVKMVVRKSGNIPQVIVWKELRYRSRIDIRLHSSDRAWLEFSALSRTKRRLDCAYAPQFG